MPYIKEKERQELLTGAPASSGQLNYCITNMINVYLHETGICYDTLNEIIGVLECAKLEFYRRVVSDYENVQKKANGDVYD